MHIFYLLGETLVPSVSMLSVALDLGDSSWPADVSCPFHCVTESDAQYSDVGDEIHAQIIFGAFPFSDRQALRFEDIKARPRGFFHSVVRRRV